jgi:hypothetical protein
MKQLWKIFWNDGQAALFVLAVTGFFLFLWCAGAWEQTP